MDLPLPVAPASATTVCAPRAAAAHRPWPTTGSGLRPTAAARAARRRASSTSSRAASRSASPSGRAPARSPALAAARAPGRVQRAPRGARLEAVERRTARPRRPARGSATSVVEPRPLGAQQGLDPARAGRPGRVAASARTALSPKTASSTLLADGRRPARDQRSRRRVSPPVCAKTASMSTSPAPFVPNEASRARSAARRPLVARPARAPRPARRAPRARAPAGTRRRDVRQLAPGRRAARGPPGRTRQASTVRSAAPSAAARTSASRLLSSACSTASVGGGRPVSERRDPVPQPADPLLAGCAVELAGADELLPAGQHLAAQHAAAADAVVDLAQRRPRRRRPPRRAAGPPSASCVVDLARDRGDPLRAGSAARRRGSCRMTVGPGVGVARRARAASRRSGATGSLGQQAASPSAAVSGDGEQRRPGRARSRRACAARWRAISRDASGGTRSSTTASAVLRCWAVCSRSQGTASAYRAADVQKIQRSAAASSWPASRGSRRRPSRCPGASSSASPRGTRRARRRAGPAPPAPASPVARDSSGRIRSPVNQPSVRGMADQHRAAGRRPQPPGAADVAPTRRVDQGGLAGAGRPADDRQQRGVEPAQPGQQVVVDLPDELGLGAAGASRPGGGEVEAQPRDAPRSASSAPARSGVVMPHDSPSPRDVPNACLRPGEAAASP